MHMRKHATHHMRAGGTQLAGVRGMAVLEEVLVRRSPQQLVGCVLDAAVDLSRAALPFRALFLKALKHCVCAPRVWTRARLGMQLEWLCTVERLVREEPSAICAILPVQTVVDWLAVHYSPEAWARAAAGEVAGAEVPDREVCAPRCGGRAC